MRITGKVDLLNDEFSSGSVVPADKEHRMARKPTYKKYELAVKAAISMTGRPDLFPELGIPRMTALYWIKQGFELEDPVLAVRQCK